MSYGKLYKNVRKLSKLNILVLKIKIDKKYKNMDTKNKKKKNLIVTFTDSHIFDTIDDLSLSNLLIALKSYCFIKNSISNKRIKTDLKK